jgi:GDP-mannose transporter
MIANCFTTAFFALFMRAKIKKVGFKDYDTVFYNNLLSIPVLLIFSLMTELPELSKMSIKYSDPQNIDEFYGLISAILLSGISGFAISYGSSWCVRVTSSTTYRYPLSELIVSMVGALNKLPIAIAGMVLFDDPVTFGGVMGVLLAFAAGIIYTIAKEQQKKQESLPSTHNGVSYHSLSKDSKD